MSVWSLMEVPYKFAWTITKLNSLNLPPKPPALFAADAPQPKKQRSLNWSANTQRGELPQLEMAEMMCPWSKLRILSLVLFFFFFFFDYVSDVGLGIVGKEGKQASLAADFSITQFSFISRLISSNYYYLWFCFDCLYILWHGRNSYHRTARLSQFVIHRGLIITFIQCVFSSVSIQFVAVVDFFYSSRYSTLPLLQYSMECWWSDTVHSTPISLCFLLFWMRMLVNL